MVQIRPDPVVANLEQDFQKRYEPNFSWKSACSVFQSLTGLRGFWAMSASDSAGNASDYSLLNHPMQYNGNPTYNYDGLVPYIDFDGTGDYLSVADNADHDILGTETTISSTIRGLTLGGWFWRDDTNCAGLICKTDGTFAYQLEWGNVVANAYLFRIFDAGGVGYSVSIVDTNTSEWKYVVARYTPSSEIKIWVNADTNTNVVAIPAAIRNTAANLLIGAVTSAPACDMDGRASMVFLCASALSDTIISAIYNQTRAMYGV